MSLAQFAWTDRARPVVEVGIGDIRIEQAAGRWDVHHWDESTAIWSGVDPTWLDVTCDTVSYRCEYGRQRTTDRFVAGTATVVVDNASGWADPNTSGDPSALTMRPGRAIRMGLVHAVYGTRWLFRGFVDAMDPIYSPVDPASVAFTCIDALGEVNRAKVPPVDPPAYAGDTVNVRIGRILDSALWPSTKRRLDPTGVTLIASDMGGQVADLMGQAADSGGGNVYGDLDANVVYRMHDWQMYDPATPVDATIGNVDDTDVCPVQWRRPFDRADLATRVIIGRDRETAQVFDDSAGQLLYGIEPFERVDLLTERDDRIAELGRRILEVRSAHNAPRVRSVTLDARTTTNALDLMTTVDVYKPSRYRCRLRYPRGDVFDAEHFATGVVHEVTPSDWTLDLNLDLAAPWEAIGGHWDGSYWDQALWSDVDEILAETRALRALVSAGGPP